MGGMYSFLRIFRRYLVEQEIQVTDELHDDYDIIFVNSFMIEYETIVQARRRLPKVVVIQRVDGSTQDYGRFDDSDARQACVNLLADLTIFQSRYSKYSTRQKYKIIAQDGPIIYNPVDTDLFQPNGLRKALPGQIRVCNTSFSTNIKKGAWQIGELAQSNPGIDFVLCGRYPELPNLPNIHLLGHLNHQELATVMRSCQVAIHLAENDPCPNVVLEALASGLPILYKESGGVPELVGKCGLPITIETFRGQLEVILAQHEEFSQAARTRAISHFAMDIIFPQYIAAIIKAKRRWMPISFRRWWALMRGYLIN